MIGRRALHVFPLLALSGCILIAPLDDLPSDGGAGGASGSSGEPTTGAGGTGSATCTPADASGFTPTFVPPLPFYQHACDASEIDAIKAACQGPSSSMSACTDVRSRFAACYSCIYTPSTSTAYGPLIEQKLGDGSSFYSVNVGGCIANADPGDAECGHTVEAMLQCESAACRTSCAGFNAYETCSDSADGASCGKWVDEASACRSAIARNSGAYACIDPLGNGKSTFLDYYSTVATLFCGPRPPVTGTLVDYSFVDNTNGTVIEAMQPRDLSSSLITAIPMTSGTFGVPLTGAGMADGTFKIPSVPDGAYYLRINSIYYLTTAITHTIAFDNVGRLDAVPPPAKTSVSLNVSGLDPWSDSDELEVVVPRNGSAMAWDGTTPQRPTAGVTSLAGFTQDWTSLLWGGFLIDSDKGDVAYLLQLVGSKMDVGGHSVTVAPCKKQLTLPQIKQVGGQTTSLDGAFSDVAQSEKISIDLRASEFQALLPNLGPNAMLSPTSATVIAGPGAEHGSVGANADLLIVSATDPVDASLDALSYGNPFPAGFGKSVIGHFFVSVPYTAPGASQTTVLTADIISTLSLTGLGAIRPLMGPVTKPMIAGRDALSPQSGVGTTPIVSWGQPAAGTPTLVELDIQELTNDAGATNASIVGVVITNGVTQAQIPPGLMQKGHSYVITIVAENASDVVTGRFRSPPYGQASLPSAIVVP